MQLRKPIIALNTFILSSFLAAQPVAAQTKTWSGVCVASDQGVVGSGDVATIQGLQCLIANVFSVFLTIIGLAGFVMLIYGSFRYMMSGGKDKGPEMAKNSITYAVYGLALALSAWFILNIIAQFTGVQSILQFSIPSSDTGL